MIFAPSLIGLATMEMPTSVTLLSEFVDNPSKLPAAGIWPLYEAIGIKKYHAEYPLGIQKNMVFQSFTPPPSAVTNLQITVEALSFDLQCEKADITEFKATQPLPPLTDSSTIKLDMGLSSSGCSHAIGLKPFSFDLGSRFLPDLMAPSERHGFFKDLTLDVWVSGLVPGICNSDVSQHKPDDRRLLWVVFQGAVNFTSDGIPGVKTMLKNQALVCNPVYSTKYVEVGKQNHQPYRITAWTETGTRKFTNLHAWDIVQAMLDSFRIEEQLGPSGNPLRSALGTALGFLAYDLSHLIFAGVFVNLDYMTKAILSLGSSSYPDLPSLLNYTTLCRSITAYYEMHAAFIVRQALMSSTNQPATGSSRVLQVRLVVKAAACQIMALLCLASAILLQVAVLNWGADGLTLVDDPRTATGVLSMGQAIRHWFPQRLGPATSSALKSALLGWNYPRGVKFPSPNFHSSADSKESSHLEIAPSSPDPAGKRSTDMSEHRPWVLRNSFRLLLCVMLCGILLVLEFVLRHSRRENGIGNSRPGTYLRYLWTLLPTLGFGLLGLLFSALDSELRTLVPFAVLDGTPNTFERSIGFNSRGILSPIAVYRLLRVRHYAAATATVTAMITSLLTIASASMFFERSVPHTFHHNLRLVGSFTEYLYSDDYWLTYGVQLGTAYGASQFGMMSGLILQSNMSYSPFTFENLGLPVMSLEPDGKGSSSSLSGFSTLKTVVPALRGGISCEALRQEEVSAELYVLDVKDTDNTTIRVNITQWPLDLPRNQQITISIPLNISAQSETVFARSRSIDVEPDFKGRRVDFLYVWGT
ncbi:hypothetical protein QBC37DRAFT_463888 [Rhypophila decipiens]|uniref:Uncharacterized protein n=1 Tax=Rhypophila decipiens TaxID=261697 RepID=A0AAN6Y7L0_9PEZI|nr:hypothetical protein QBC37DRAFT_463888 [Rhypophila decipiens]